MPNELLEFSNNFSVDVSNGRSVGCPRCQRGPSPADNPSFPQEGAGKAQNTRCPGRRVGDLSLRVDARPGQLDRVGAEDRPTPVRRQC